MRLVLALVFCALSGTVLLANGAAVQALNDYRSAQGHAPLEYSDALAAAAQAHAADMATVGFFDHTGSDGSTVAQRVSQQGYGWCIVAENIAKGQQSLDEVMQAWIKSDGHRRNMLSPEVAEFALAQGPDDIWVMVLAAPGC